MHRLVFGFLVTSLILLLTGCPGLFNVDTDQVELAAESFDTDAPLPPSVSGEFYTTQLPPPINFSGSGGGVGIYRIRSNGGEWQVTTEPPPFFPSGVNGVGEYVVEVQERDQSGNWSDSGVFTFRVVTALPPTPRVTNDAGIPSGAFTNLTTHSWSWEDIRNVDPTADVDLYWRYSIDGKNWTETAGTGTTIGPLSDGSYTFFVEQRLRLGGWTARGSFNLTVDTTPPPAPWVEIRNGAGSFERVDSPLVLHTGNPTLRLMGRPTGGGDGRMEYDFNAGAETGAPQEGVHFTLSPPSYPAGGSLLAGERDAAGNIAIGPTGVSLAHDPSAPLVTGPSQTNNPRPTWTISDTHAGTDTYEVTLSNGSGSYTFSDVTGPTFRPDTDIAPGIGDPYSLEVVAFDSLGFRSAVGSLPGGTEILPPGTILDLSSSASVMDDTDTVTFTIVANEPPETDTVVELLTGGSYETADLSGVPGPGSTFTVTLPAGASSVDFSVSGMPDPGEYDTESIQISILSGTGYIVGAGATRTVSVNDTSPVPSVTLSYTGADIISDTETASFTITASEAPDADLTIALISAAGYDPARVSVPSTAILPAGSTSMQVLIDPVAGTDYPDQYVELSVAPGTGYTAATATPARVLVRDNVNPALTYVGKWDFNGSLASSEGELSSWSTGDPGAVLSGGLYSFDGGYSTSATRANVSTINKSSFTIALRFRMPNAGASTRPIIVGGNSSRWLNLRNTNGTLDIIINNFSQTLSTGLSVGDNQWHTLVVSFEDAGGLTATASIDGESASVTFTESFGPGIDNVLISDNLSNARAFAGDWDWVALVNGVASYGQMVEFLGYAPW
jgi:hypothetical protein